MITVGPFALHCLVAPIPQFLLYGIEPVNRIFLSSLSKGRRGLGNELKGEVAEETQGNGWPLFQPLNSAEHPSLLLPTLNPQIGLENNERIPSRNSCGPNPELNLLEGEKNRKHFT